jgi:hypothetical protein
MYSRSPRGKSILPPACNLCHFDNNCVWRGWSADHRFAKFSSRADCRVRDHEVWGARCGRLELCSQCGPWFPVDDEPIVVVRTCRNVGDWQRDSARHMCAPTCSRAKTLEVTFGEPLIRDRARTDEQRSLREIGTGREMMRPANSVS